MAFKFDNADEGFPSSLDLFKPPVVNTAIYRREWISFRPVSQISKGSPILFTIPGSSSDYKDLGKSTIYVKCRILKQDGTPVTPEDNVAFSNLSLQSLFRQVDVSLQQQSTTSSIGLNYPYKAMLDSLLKYEEDPKETFMQAQLYYKDSAYFMDDSNPTTGGNVGLSQRFEFTKDGAYVDLEGPVYADLCQQEKLLLNGVQIDFKFNPSNDPFALMTSDAGEKYTFEIGEAILKICHAKLNPGLVISHAEALKSSPAIYSYTRSDIRTFNVQPGSFAMEVDDLFQSQVPSRVVIALVSAQAYSGAYHRNPYNFEHFNLGFMGLYLDGQSVPGDPISCDYANKQYVSAYLSLFTGIGKFRLNEGNYILREEYAGGNAIYVYDIAGKEGQGVAGLVRKGHMRLSLRFKEPPTETLTALVYSSFPSILQIDESRSIF